MFEGYDELNKIFQGKWGISAWYDQQYWGGSIKIDTILWVICSGIYESWIYGIP